MLRRSVPEQIESGVYRILSAVPYYGKNLFVVSRGREVQLVQIPIEACVIPTAARGHEVLEIKDCGTFKMPIWRNALPGEEVEIDNYTGFRTMREPHI